MDRTFVLPVSLAAALHGALLFGIHRGPTPPHLVETLIGIVIPTPMPPPDEPETVVDPRAADKAPLQTFVPTSVDESLPRPGFHIDIPKIPGLSAVHPLDHLGPIQLGVPDGLANAAWSSAVASINLDNAPRTRTQVPPMFPAEARQRGESGRVVVEFVVDEMGRVVEPRVVQSTNRIFDEPTLRAIARWRFEPGKRQGQVVRFRMALPVEFNLSESN